MTRFDDAFDKVAGTYDAVRPGYPEAVFDAIESYAALPPSPAVLEIGVGTGQATRQMAARGWTVDGVEPGRELVATARSRLAASGRVTVRATTFEAADVDERSYDLVASATAWHWVDPTIGYAKAARALERGGTLALWWNAHVPDTTDARWQPIRHVYEDVAPELAVLARLTPDRPDYDPAAELRGCGHFGTVETRVFPFTVEYTLDAFLALLDTYASHRHLDERRRRLLDDRLTAAVDEQLGGTVTKPYEAVLVMARPRE